METGIYWPIDSLVVLVVLSSAWGRKGPGRGPNIFPKLQEVRSRGQVRGEEP